MRKVLLELGGVRVEGVVERDYVLLPVAAVLAAGAPFELCLSRLLPTRSLIPQLRGSHRPRLPPAEPASQRQNRLRGLRPSPGRLTSVSGEASVGTGRQRNTAETSARVPAATSCSSYARQPQVFLAALQLFPACCSCQACGCASLAAAASRN